MDELRGKNAIVTGSNRGLGLSFVMKLAEAGCNVWACMRSKSTDFNNKAQELNNRYNVRIIPVYFDLTSTDEIKEAYKTICKETKNIDILINNAGMGHMGFFQMTKMSDIRTLYEVNLFAPMQLTQYVLRNMQRQGYGRIINVASTAATEIYEGNSIYGASKSALIAWTKSLAAETMRYGVTVNAIAPGLVETRMSEVFEGKDPQEPLRHTALGRKIKPDEIADIVVELLKSKMSIINGEVIYIHGGHK